MNAFIVPIFVPNIGCPTRCVFCEQQRITSEPRRIPSPASISDLLKRAIGSKKVIKGRHPQVAFYGGTFTHLPFDTMKTLLEAVSPFIKDGYFESIRVSTRPDALDTERLELMKHYGVKTVELGAQSMDDKILAAAKRKHTAEDTSRAVQKLKEKGFSVGIQLMPGLPGETPGSFDRTVIQTVKLKPDAVRLYPTVVIKGTELAEMYRTGRYEPLSLNDAVQMCAKAVIRIESAGIPVIRIGLMSSPTLLKPGQIVAGPWHPCFGAVVRSEVYHRKIADAFPLEAKGKRLCIAVNPREVPLLRGYKNQGVRAIEEKTGAKVLSVHMDPCLKPGEIRVSES